MTKNSAIILRPTSKNDLETLFLFQCDQEANYLAAFTPENPMDKTAYITKWSNLLSNKTVHIQTIFFKNKIVGSIAKYELFENAEITYWIGKEFWGHGIASEALRQFLVLEQTRPLFGRTAFDNIGSQKVLTRCGFLKTGTEKGFSNARNKEIEEFIYELN